jgi:hypothetical protein
VAFEFSELDSTDQYEAALRDLRSLRRLVHAKNVHEAGLLLLSTSLAAKFLRRSQRIPLEFPEAYLAGDVLAVDMASKRMLSDYAEELIQLERNAAVSSLPFAGLTAPGFGVLARSVEAVGQASIQFLHEGRALWQELLRGLPAFEFHYRDILDADATDADIKQDLFIPLMLVPEWPTKSAAEAAGHDRQRTSLPESQAPEPPRRSRVPLSTATEPPSRAPTVAVRDVESTQSQLSHGSPRRGVATSRENDERVLESIRAALTASD